jgi:predicted dehydrogenase
MRLRVYVGERSWWKPFHEDIIDVEHADPQARQLEHFCSVICGETGPLATGQDGLQTLRVTLAIHEATRTEGSVHLPLAEYTGSTVDKDRS